MSLDASIRAELGPGEQTFRLGIGQWAELQERCGGGLVEILDRLLSRRWRAADVVETVRQGLFGAGMAPYRANALVQRHVEGRPLADSVGLAQIILCAALHGPPSEGKAPAEGSDGTAGSTSPPSTEPAP